MFYGEVKPIQPICVLHRPINDGRIFMMFEN